MTPLTQQLEDKKKEQLKLKKDNKRLHFEWNQINISENEEKYRKDACFIRLQDNIYQIERCRCEIAILEQAIAEIKELQSQQNKTGNVEAKQSYSNRENNTGSADISNLLQKQRQEILDKIDKWALNVGYQENTDEFFKDVERLKQQLNQPKTDENNNTIQNPNN